MTTIHNLKVHPQFWDGLASGAKPFEIRRNDRRFAVGDVCLLREYDPSHGYTGKDAVERKITYILHNEDFPIGIHLGFVALGFGELQALDKFKVLLEKRKVAKQAGDRVEAYATKLELNALVMRLQRDGFDVGIAPEETINPPC